jgi:hypothetical protein
MIDRLVIGGFIFLSWGFILIVLRLLVGFIWRGRRGFFVIFFD